VSKPPPKITDALIREWVGDTYAQRGRAYFHEGRVLKARWKGSELIGEVQGSYDEPYDVLITFEGKEAYGDCSCPMEYDCKHVAAVLYAAMQAPPSLAPTKRRNFDKLLTKLERPALVALVKAMLEASPELGNIVEAHAATANITALAQQAGDDGALRREVQSLLQKAEKPGQSRAAQRGLELMLEQAENLMKAKDWATAATIARTVLDEMLMTDGTDFGSRYELASLHEAAAKALLTCWAKLPGADPVRGQALRTMFDFLAWDIHQGWRSLEAQKIGQSLARAVTPSEREQVLEWIAVAMRQQARLTQAEAYGEGDDFFEEDPLDQAYGFGSPEAWKKLRARFTAKATGKTPAQKRARRPASRKVSPTRAQRPAPGRKRSGGR
jgi:uncharacterized Zn finger protein